MRCAHPVTPLQLIFVADEDPSATKSSSPSPLESLSVPHTYLLSTKFEQPYFGSNYLILEIKPSSNGGLTDGTRAEIRLKDKGIFEFASALEKTRERTIYMKRQQAAEDDDSGLRMYFHFLLS